jgi:hypothetical protein
MMIIIIIAMALPLSNIHAQSEKEKAMTRTAEQFISQMTIDEKISQLMNEASGY